MSITDWEVKFRATDVALAKEMDSHENTKAALEMVKTDLAEARREVDDLRMVNRQQDRGLSIAESLCKRIPMISRCGFDERNGS